MGKKFAEYSQFDLSKVNAEVLKKWDENQVFAKSMTDVKAVLLSFFMKDRPLPTVCRAFTT